MSKDSTDILSMHNPISREMYFNLQGIYWNNYINKQTNKLAFKIN